MPEDLEPGTPDVDAYLDSLNEELLGQLKTGGELFVTNAIVGGRFVLRACIVNFRTTDADGAAVPDLVARHGRALDAETRPASLRASAAR